MVRRKHWVAGVLTASVVGIVCQIQQAEAATATWAAPVDGLYSAATNWVGNAAPTSTDNPLYAVDGAYTVTFDGSVSSYAFQADAGAVRWDAGSHTYTLTGTSTIATLVGQTATLTLGSGNFSLNGLGELIVGRGGDGTLLVNGAQLTAGTVHVGGTFTPPAGTGNVVVTGNGSQVNAAAFHVGVGGTGSVTVNQGGRVSISEQSVIGLLPGAVGTVTVRDVDSRYDARTLTVGQLGDGTMTIEAGSIGSGLSWSVGYSAGGTGSLTVDGATAAYRSTLNLSYLSATADLWVGYQGCAVMHVTNGALASVAGNVSIATATGASGVLDVGGAAGGYSATLTAQSLWIGGPKPTQYPQSGGTGELDVNAGGLVTISGSSSVGGTSATGTVVLNGGTLQSGSMGVMAGGALHLHSGTLEINAGNLVMQGADFVLAAENPGSTMTVRLTHALGGTSTFARSGNVVIGGDASAAGDAGVLELQAGGLATVGGTTTLWAAGTLLLSGGTLTTGALVNSGGAIIWNSGTVALTGDFLSDAAAPLGPSVLLTGGRTLSVAGQLAIGPGGTITLQGGTLTAGSTALSGGRFVLTSGALVLTQSGLEIGSGQLLGDQVTLVSGQSVTASGDVTVDAGASLILQGGFLTANTIVNHGAFQFVSGQLSLHGDLAVDAGGLFGPTLTLGAGKLLILSGSVQVATGAVIQLSGGSLSAGAITNDGTIACSATGSLTLGAAGLTNHGTFLKTGTGSLVVQGGPLANAGSVDVAGGTLVVAGITGTGSVTVAAGALLVNGKDWTLDGSSILNNAGTVQLTSGTTVVSAPLTMTGGWTLAGGVLDVEAAMEIGQLTMPNVFASPPNGGLTIGTGKTLTVDGLFTWSEQAIQGGGTMDAKGGITMATASTKTLLGTLTNEGSAIWSAGTLTLGGGTLNNVTGATFDMRISSQSGTAVTVNNAGTLIKSSSSGTVELKTVNNSGAVQVTRGKLIIDGGAVGGTLSVDASAVLAFGTLTVSGDVSGGGEVDVMASAATTFTGAYAPKKTVVGAHATATFASGADLTGFGDVVSSAGSLTTVSTGHAVTMGSVTIGGEMDVFDPLDVTGTLSLATGGKLVMWDTLTLDGPGQLTWTGGVLDVSRGGISGMETVTIPTAGVLIMDDTAFAGTIIVNGELDIVHDGQLVAMVTGGGTSVPEAGTLGVLAMAGMLGLRRPARRR